MNDISFSGELDIALTLKHLPTRSQGMTAFSLPYLKFDVTAPLQNNNEVFLRFESAEYREGNLKRLETRLKEGYLSLTNGLPAKSEFRYGLIPNFYIELQREQWDYDFWGMGSTVPLIKYKYTSWSDLGGLYQSELPNEWGQWGLSLINGEGLESDETGSHKEAQLLLKITGLAPFYVLLGYTYGAYENLDPSFSKKARLVAHFSYEWTNALLALEYYNTQDPADVITSQSMAAGVDVVALHATNVEGQGGSLFGRLDFTEKTDLFIRADWLNPVKQDNEKNLKAISTGVAYDPSEDIRWALGFEYTDYSDEFSASLRDESQLVLATRVGF